MMSFQDDYVNSLSSFTEFRTLYHHAYCQSVTILDMDNDLEIERNTVLVVLGASGDLARKKLVEFIECRATCWC